MSLSQRRCTHADVREFSDGLRTCLACGETRFREEPSTDQEPSEDLEYIYTDLRCLERGRTVRLVVLAPGNDGDPVHCTLVLSGILHSEYDAVSYTWATEEGDDSKTDSVFIDGCVLKVTQNCHAALCQLRHPERHRRLWIDAICINQFNVRERNHQVGIMDAIYRAAMQVQLCITDSSCDFTSAMKWLSQAGGRLSDTEDELSNLVRLCRCRYFSRAWIIQEVVLAKSIKLHVNSGKMALTNDVLIGLQHAVADQLPESLRMRLSPQRAVSLTEQLRASIKLSCSDPRDHIYAILSLLDPLVRASIPVDYALSLTQLYATVVAAYVKACRNLHVLAYAAAVATDPSISVTRSLTIARFHHFLLHDNPLEQDALEEHPLKWAGSVHISSESDDEHTLSSFCSRVWAIQTPLDSRQILSGFKVRIHSDQVCETLYEQSSNFVAFNTSLPKDFTDDLRSKALAAAEILQRNAEPAEYSLTMIHQRIFSRIATPKSVQAVRDAVNRLVNWKIPGSSLYLFGTSQGVGRSILPARAGDRVCYVDGMRTQLLIRRVDGCRYRIVSSCLWLAFHHEHQLPECAELVELF